MYFFLTLWWWVWGHPQQWTSEGGRKHQRGGAGAATLHQRAFPACSPATAPIRALWLDSLSPTLPLEVGMSSFYSDPSNNLPGLCFRLPGCARDFWAQKFPLLVNLWRIWAFRIRNGAYHKWVLMKLEILLFCGKCLQIFHETVWWVLECSEMVNPHAFCLPGYVWHKSMDWFGVNVPHAN